MRHVHAISGVSGGSIIAAFAALKWNDMSSAGCDAAAFDKFVTAPFVSAITSRSLFNAWLRRLALAGSVRAFDSTYTRTTAFGDVLSESLYNDRLCTDLPTTPYTVLNATSLLSMRAWRFTRDGLGDSRIGYSMWKSNNVVPVGHAVAASAAFPPMFSPARIDARRYSFGGTVYRDNPVHLPKTIALTDGGVYENLGTEVLTKSTPLPGGKLLQPAEFLLVSDGGYPARYEFDLRWLPGIASLSLLRRVNTIALEQVSALRRRGLVRLFEEQRQHGLLVALGSSLDRIPDGGGDTYRAMVGEESCPPAEVVQRIHRVRTHLNKFSKDEADVLMYHGYVLTDAFLWARNAHLPAMYRRPDVVPEWRVVYTPDVVTGALKTLEKSHHAW
jgi:NTE family protein